MNKRVLIFFSFAFLLFYLLNYLMPLVFGDDYVYAFVWQGTRMDVPLPKDAVRVLSWHDLVSSQWVHYLTWGGRTVNSVLAQFFLWAGKSTFNFLNAFISVLLIVEIYWCIYKGKISLQFKPGMLYWIFISVWAFTPAFSAVFLWLVGACNYLWPAVLLLAFIRPYINKYYCLQEMVDTSVPNKYSMFFLGLVSGWTNENSVCWIIFAVILLIIYLHKKQRKIDTWLFAGLVGLMVGYMLLLFSPGNVARLASDDRQWFNMEMLLHRLFRFSEVFLFQLFLWHFCLRSLRRIKSQMNVLTKEKAKYLKKEILLVNLLCILAVGMSGIMLLSPEFPLRSAFPGTVQLIIATGIVIRLQKEYGVATPSKTVKKFLIITGAFYFAITSSVFIHHLYKHYTYTQNLFFSIDMLKSIPQEKTKVLCVNPFPKASRAEEYMSGFRTFDNNLSENPTYWENVAVARYYGIAGIRRGKANSLCP